MLQTIQYELNEHLQTIQNVINHLENDILKATNRIIDTLKQGNKIIICGNGGSAADAQHFAAELTGRYKMERMALPAIAITTDTSAITAIGNDYGYERVFDRQVEAYAKSNDIVFGISTSGNSQNIINAFKLAKEKGCYCIGLSGKDGGKMKDVCDINIIIPSNNTPRIQEMHILIIHIICQIIDDNFIMV
jgi:D-sedoheptulose 7-phosphate isomerase